MEISSRSSKQLMQLFFLYYIFLLMQQTNTKNCNFTIFLGVICLIIGEISCLTEGNKGGRIQEDPLEKGKSVLFIIDLYGSLV